MDVMNYSFRAAHSPMKGMNKPVQLNPMTALESLIPIVKDMYRNDPDKDGRQNDDGIVMMRMLSLQSSYNSPDESREKVN